MNKFFNDKNKITFIIFLLKTFKFISLFIFFLFIAACTIFCIKDGFINFMLPFVLSLAFFLLNTKQPSKPGFIDIVKDLFFNFFITFIIIILITCIFLFLGLIDFTFIETIYCDGGDESDSDSSKPTKLESPGTSSINNSLSFFLFLNKLPGWFKTNFKYIALYLILLFITSVLGYNSNIIKELSSNFPIYFVYFLKIGTILNFFVVLYYLFIISVLKMYANNIEIIKPEDCPKLIKNDLIEWKEFATNSTPIELAHFYNHCYFLIFLYISIVLLGLTSVVLCSTYLLPPI